MSAWGLLTLTKPAWLHSGGGRWASHFTGVHCTATEPSSHSQAWQLLTHRSPGWNRPAQGPPRLPDGTPASRAAPRSRASPGAQFGRVSPRCPRPATASRAARETVHPVPAPAPPGCCPGRVDSPGGRVLPPASCLSEGRNTHEFGEPIWSHAGWKERGRGVTGDLGVRGLVAQATGHKDISSQA